MKTNLYKTFSIALFVGMFSLCLLGLFERDASAATSPTLAGVADYSVLAGDEVTCTGSTTTTGDVGVSPGTLITGFPVPCVAGPPGTTYSNDASAIAAQADALTAFGTLDQPCDQTFGAVDLTATFPSGVGPGVYCSTSSFTLTGNLDLTGSGVWIFKTVSTLITSPGSSVTGGDPCNVWWRIGSSTTLDTTTSFVGTIISQNGANAMNTGATLNGRFLGLSAATVTLDANTISGPTCVPSLGPGGGGSSGPGGGGSSPGLPNAGIGPEGKSNISWNVLVPTGFVIALSSFFLARKKWAI